jgi:hypothetical protein
VVDVHPVEILQTEFPIIVWNQQPDQDVGDFTEKGTQGTISLLSAIRVNSPPWLSKRDELNELRQAD